MRARKAYVEAPPDLLAGCQRREDQPVRIRRQPGIRMKEQQHLSRGHTGARIHLSGPSPRGLQHLVDLVGGQRGRAVAAAAIHHDHLMTACPHSPQAVHTRNEILGFIEGRNNDGDAWRYPGRCAKAFNVGCAAN